MYGRLKNKINDMHCKLINYLTKTNKTIIIPKFGTQSMLKKKLLSGDNKYALQMQSHYSFRKRLIDKAQIEGCNVLVCNEMFTTQTCGRCFNKRRVGGSKTYSCNMCNFTIDRDLNSARNILIRCIH